MSLEKRFELSARGSNLRQEMIAGLTTFLAMVYSVIVVPNMLGAAGFPAESVFIATCLVAGLGSILIGLWANAPMAIGCAISLTAFTAFSLVIGQKVSIPVALGAVFLMGAVFTLISATGVRSWILRNLPSSIAHGAGIGIGLFLLLIAANGVGIVVGNQAGLPVKLGDFASFPVMMSLLGLAFIIGLERMQVKGGILPVVFALVMTAVFDATGTIRAVAGQAGLLDKDGQIINGGKALTSDSVSSLFSGIFGTAPAAVYIESAAGTAAGGKTGLTAIVVGVLFLLMLFFQPLATLVPGYATAPALMYVGLLMLSNVSKLDFSDFVGAMSGLVCAVFIVLTANIVTGIMLGFATLVIGRLVSGEIKQLNIGTIIITVALVAFYAFGLAI